jgi:hypothetical protein
MKKIVLSLALAGASLLLASGALAHRSSHPSTVAVVDAATVPDDPSTTYVVGRVTSPSAKCIANRTIKMSFYYDTELSPKLVDTAKTSTNGLAAGEGPNSDNGHTSFGVKLQLLKKNVGTKRHPQICGADSVSVG